MEDGYNGGETMGMMEGIYGREWLSFGKLLDVKYLGISNG